MAEETELTLEEMKALISVANILPALLDKIDNINKKIDGLEKSFEVIKGYYKHNTEVVEEHLDKVKELLEDQVDSRRIINELIAINQSITDIEERLKVKEEEQVVVKEEEAPKAKRGSKKVEKSYDEEVVEIADKIVSSHRGRKTRLLTIQNVKQGFHCDEEKAKKVLKLLENRNLYDPESHILTFPKR